MPLWWKIIFNKVAGPTILLKMDAITEVFPHRFCKIALLKTSEIVFARCLCHSFSNKVSGLQSIDCNFTENDVFDKNYI